LITGREDYRAHLTGTGRTAKTRASAQVSAPLALTQGGRGVEEDFDGSLAIEERF